jgi:hypothetical protein
LSLPQSPRCIFCPIHLYSTCIGIFFNMCSAILCSIYAVFYCKFWPLPTNASKRHTNEIEIDMLQEPVKQTLPFNQFLMKMYTTNLILSRSFAVFLAFFMKRCLRSSLALGLCKKCDRELSERARPDEVLAGIDRNSRYDVYLCWILPQTQ